MIITAIFLLVFLTLFMSLVFLDAKVYQISFLQSLYGLYSFEWGTRKTIVIVTSLLGLIICFFTDYRIRKEKKNKAANK